MKQIAIIILASLLLQGCLFSSKSVFAPKPFGMNQAEKGTPEFNKGWEDGCETGMSTMSTDYYKSFYTFRQDPDMITNIEYYKAWKDAYTYCRQYVFKWSLWTWDAK